MKKKKQFDNLANITPFIIESIVSSLDILIKWEKLIASEIIVLKGFQKGGGTEINY